jgi:methylated-DNA-[protein]-cysteine S-methyltransferase
MHKKIDNYIPIFEQNIFYKQEISTPLGVLTAIADDNYLYACFFDNELSNDSIAKLTKTYCAKIKHQTNPVIKKTAFELDSYFNNKLQNFTLPLKLTGTIFQKRVWQELLKIPYGKTISYLQEAKNIGKPTAFRAVANANGRNLLPIIIPCHRVISSNGKIGGYTGGLDKKKYLLNLENSFSM